MCDSLSRSFSVHLSHKISKNKSKKGKINFRSETRLTYNFCEFADSRLQIFCKTLDCFAVIGVFATQKAIVLEVCHLSLIELSTVNMKNVLTTFVHGWIIIPKHSKSFCYNQPNEIKTNLEILEERKKLFFSLI